MRMMCHGVYVGRKSFTSNKTNNTYVDLKVLDETGDTLLFSLPEGIKIPELQQFDKISIVLDVVQGKYPKYNIYSINIMSKEIEQSA